MRKFVYVYQKDNVKWTSKLRKSLLEIRIIKNVLFNWIVFRTTNPQQKYSCCTIVIFFFGYVFCLNFLLNHFPIYLSWKLDFLYGMTRFL